MPRKLDEVISNLEDVGNSLEEVEEGIGGRSTLANAEEALERATDDLEAINDAEEEE